MLACVYMPCDTGKSDDEFDYVLSVISSLELQFNTDFVIIGGDLNADLSRLQSSHTSSLIDYCKENNLTCVNSKYLSIDYTYCNDATNSRSLIDHFIVSDSLCDNVNKT